jgi:hypothetical protein
MSVTVQAVTDAETAVDGYHIEVLGPGEILPRKFTDWHNYDSETLDIETESPETDSDALSRVLRTENETLFRPWEASKHRRRLMRRLKNHQLDLNKYRVDVNQPSKIDIDIKFHSMLALGAQLEMSPRMIWRATRMLFTIDNRREGLPSDVLGFCIYAHIINHETEEYEKRTHRLWNESSPGEGPVYWPGRPAEMNCRHFERVANHLCSSHPNVTESVVQSLLQRLQNGGVQQGESNYVPAENEVRQRTSYIEDRVWTPPSFDNLQDSPE